MDLSAMGAPTRDVKSRTTELLERPGPVAAGDGHLDTFTLRVPVKAGVKHSDNHVAFRPLVDRSGSCSRRHSDAGQSQRVNLWTIFGGLFSETLSYTL